jgi:hypothetical protein
MAAVRTCKLEKSVATFNAYFKLERPGKEWIFQVMSHHSHGCAKDNFPQAVLPFGHFCHLASFWAFLSPRVPKNILTPTHIHSHPPIHYPVSQFRPKFFVQTELLCLLCELLACLSLVCITFPVRFVSKTSNLLIKQSNNSKSYKWTENFKSQAPTSLFWKAGVENDYDNGSKARLNIESSTRKMRSLWQQHRTGSLIH